MKFVLGVSRKSNISAREQSEQKFFELENKVCLRQRCEHHVLQTAVLEKIHVISRMMLFELKTMSS